MKTQSLSAKTLSKVKKQIKKKYSKEYIAFRLDVQGINCPEK